MYVCMYVCMSCMYVCHVCMYVCHVCMYVCACMYVCTCIRYLVAEITFSSRLFVCSSSAKVEAESQATDMLSKMAEDLIMEDDFELDPALDGTDESAYEVLQSELAKLEQELLSKKKLGLVVVIPGLGTTMQPLNHLMTFLNLYDSH